MEAEQIGIGDATRVIDDYPVIVHYNIQDPSLTSVAHDLEVL